MENRASFDDLYGRKSKDYDSRTVRIGGEGKGEGGDDYLRLKIFLKGDFFRALFFLS